ncbi:MAG: hypothetical protein IIV19_05300 [Bacteroidaceae bacterium]|nr:hypothetical protein [Bacteroidaceae bacterium]
MKKAVYCIAAIISIAMFAACGESIEEKAQRSLQTARVAYEAGDFQSAKIELDSLKILYPKAFNARREAMKLMREVELAEQQRSVACFDSMLVAKRTELENVIKSDFVFEKDEKYQEIGNFMIASQAPMKNLMNSYLRGQVDENGVLTITSIYRGKAISHNKVKVSVGDSFAESANPISNYTSKHLGVTTERVDFRFGKDEGIIGFIVLNAGKSIKVELSGKSSYSYTMRQEDVKAITKLYDLSMLLSSIRELEAAKQEAWRHIEFIERNKQRSEEATATPEQ